jgi:hypothetical protein
MIQDPDEGFNMAELDEALAGIAAGYAGRHQYFVVVRAWMHLLYRNILYSVRLFRGALPGRAALALLLTLFIVLSLWCGSWSPWTR